MPLLNCLLGFSSLTILYARTSHFGSLETQRNSSLQRFIIKAQRRKGPMVTLSLSPFKHPDGENHRDGCCDDPSQTSSYQQ